MTSTSRAHLAMLAIASIIPPSVALRAVDRDGDQYKDLRASIKDNGVLESILVKPTIVKDENGNETEKFQVINGLQRYSAAVDLGMTEIPCTIADADEIKSLKFQVITNLLKVDTAPIAYSRQLLKLVAADPTTKLEDLATELRVSLGWLKDRLRLQKLVPSIQTLVEAGRIPLSSAYIIAKLPDEEQPEWIEDAQKMPPDQFLPRCSNRINELKKQKSGEPKPEPTQAPVVRKRGEILDMYRNVTVGEPTSDTEKGFVAALKWITQMDPDSVAAWEKDQAEKAAKREAKAAERAAEKAKKADLPSIDDLLGVG